MNTQYHINKTAQKSKINSAVWDAFFRRMKDDPILDEEPDTSGT